MSADYLFMQDKLYDVQYDTGDKVIQCGRHNDIFKLWLQWRAKVLTNVFTNAVYAINAKHVLNVLPHVLVVYVASGVSAFLRMSGNVARRGEAEFL